MKITELDGYLASKKFRETQGLRLLRLAWRDWKNCEALVNIANERGFKNATPDTLRPRLNELELVGLVKTTTNKESKNMRGSAVVCYAITPRGWDVVGGNTTLYRVAMFGIRKLIEDRAAAFSAPMEMFTADRAAEIREAMSHYTSVTDTYQ